jgi:hypothetical protein
MLAIAPPRPAPPSPARWLRALALGLLALLLAGCGGGPVVRVFPPEARVNEITVLPGGEWQVSLRLQNFSTVPMRMDAVDAVLSVNGIEAGRIATQPGFLVGPFTSDVHAITLRPSPAASDALVAALASRRALRYAITGTITSSEPRERDWPFDFDSALSPVPGLDGVLR